jgi:ElaB/YqjD/DUF883 family membrane-anchored ribosome-binding protein
MVKADAISKEINELRKEIEALRSEYAEAKRSTAKAAARGARRFGAIKDEVMEEASGLKDRLAEGAEEATADILEQLEELKDMLKDYEGKAEKTVGDHPLAAVGGALAIGFLIGRLTR